MIHTSRQVLYVGAFVLSGTLSVSTVAAQTPQDDARWRLEELQAVNTQHSEAVRHANALLEAIKTDPVGYKKAYPPQPVGGLLVALVLGDLREGEMPSNLSSEARKALEDMKGFLPYRSYQLLDAVTIPTSPETAQARLLRGNERRALQFTDHQVYQLQVAASGATASSLRLTVALEEAPAPTVGAQDNLIRGFTTRLDQIAKELATGDMSRWANLKVEERALRAEADELWRTLRPYQVTNSRSRFMRPIVSTGFTMELGETVVVGTSRVNGEKALILLVTAVR